MLGAMWLLLIRPQQQRVKAHRELIESLAVGDEVLTVGGLFGRIIDVNEDRVTLAVSPTVDLTFAKPAISQRIGPESGGSGGFADEDGAQ